MAAVFFDPIESDLLFKPRFVNRGKIWDYLLLEYPTRLESPASLIRRIKHYHPNIPSHILESFSHSSESALEIA